MPNCWRSAGPMRVCGTMRTRAAMWHDMNRCRPQIFAFIPYAVEQGVLVSPYYETPQFRADVAQWFAPMPVDWEWRVITGDNLEVEIAKVAAISILCPTIVLNLCDGDDLNGYPGLRVVQALAAAGIATTGADEGFYALSTSKLAMKSCFQAADVSTAPWLEIREIDKDVRRAGEILGWPLFLKPDVSFGSAGITLRSVIRDHASGCVQAQALLAGLHGCRFDKDGIFAEPFLSGREFTVLMQGDAAKPDELRVFAPCERVFHSALPREEHYLTYERYCEEYDQDTPPPPGEPYYRYAPVAAVQAAAVADLARRAYIAVGGCGYGRIDIRSTSMEGVLYVLEVNANCGLSSDDTSTAGAILALSGSSMQDFICCALQDAWKRRHGQALPLRLL